MQSEWPIVPAADCCDLIVDCVNKTAPIAEGATPFRMIRTTNVRNGFIDLADCKFVDEETFRIWTRRAKVLDSDVILTREAPIGEVGLVRGNQNIFLGQRLMQYRANRSLLDPRFLCYAFLSPQLQHQFGAHEGSGSVVSHIRVGDCSKFKVPLPPLPVQREIAELLGSIDERVLLLRQTNATLESIAQALFKSWFIDFDPVRAKAEGREPEGMDAATAALFPAEFEESALGLIPKGWRAGSVANMAALNAASWTARRAPTEVAYIDLAGVKANVFDPPQRLLFEDAPSRARRELRSGDTLVGTVRPGNRSFGFIADAEPGLTGSTGFAVLSPLVPNAAAFVYLCATRDENIERLAALADGGAYPAVRPELVLATVSVLPSVNVLNAFHEVASPLLRGIAENTRRLRLLAELRDTLLPRLISGKLRLSTAQDAVEGAIA